MYNTVSFKKKRNSSLGMHSYRKETICTPPKFGLQKKGNFKEKEKEKGEGRRGILYLYVMYKNYYNKYIFIIYEYLKKKQDIVCLPSPPKKTRTSGSLKVSN